MDYYEVVVYCHGKYVRFIKYDMSCALEAAHSIVMKHLLCDEDALSIDIYSVKNSRHSIIVHIEV